MASSLACTISTPKHTAAFLSIRLPAQPSHQPLAHRGDRVLARAASSEPQQSATASQQDIEGLRSTYCDDFECTSSPAVEATVRAFSRDLTRANGVYTRSLLFRDVVYKV